eukprot:Gregarina_sp_Poly_1__8489@NODE_4_length_26097_cov_247_784211_g3_i0_p23_GENE_NODE_4_length_26097_cov_247_784211_g3_i0NODE_4_length_26097_cov_247_784211_g3_i0_p23_ORF_typecomplete_len119_score5_19SKG6/PF08693_10/2_7e02SKG6/PF08693_10/4_6_NODE_4_length_26097_cov_247_784211_g3_i018302186
MKASVLATNSSRLPSSNKVAISCSIGGQARALSSVLGDTQQSSSLLSPQRALFTFAVLAGCFLFWRRPLLSITGFCTGQGEHHGDTEVVKDTMLRIERHTSPTKTKITSANTSTKSKE